MEAFHLGSVKSGNQVTVFILSVGDPAFPYCEAALKNQTFSDFHYDVIRNVAPFSAAMQEMIRRSQTEFVIQLDEDMILQPDAIERMVSVISQMPKSVAMVCFHLWDVDREMKIQGIKIYRTSVLKKVMWNDFKASEMDLLQQFLELGVKWILHPDAVGNHGAIFAPETIYLRYKTLYEKDISSFNLLTNDLYKKVQKFREKGDMLQLFAIFGAVHGIVNASFSENKEKNYQQYDLESINVFKRLFLDSQMPEVYQKFNSTKELYSSPNPSLDFDILMKIKAIVDEKNEYEFYIWGTGSVGLSIFNYITALGISIKGFIDSDTRKDGSLVKGIKILAPQRLEGSQGRTFVFIGSMYHAEIEPVLHSLGYLNGVDYVNVF